MRTRRRRRSVSQFPSPSWVTVRVGLDTFICLSAEKKLFHFPCACACVVPVLVHVLVPVFVFVIVLLVLNLCLFMCLCSACACCFHSAFPRMVSLLKGLPRQIEIWLPTTFFRQLVKEKFKLREGGKEGRYEGRKEGRKENSHRDAWMRIHFWHREHAVHRLLDLANVRKDGR